MALIFSGWSIQIRCYTVSLKHFIKRMSLWRKPSFSGSKILTLKLRFVSIL